MLIYFTQSGLNPCSLTAVNELSETFPHFIPVPLQSRTELNTEIDCSLYSHGGLQQHAFIIAHTHKCATHFMTYQTLNDKHMSGRKILMESPSIQWPLWFLIKQSQGYYGRQTDIYESPVAIYYIYMAHMFKRKEGLCKLQPCLQSTACAPCRRF